MWLLGVAIAIYINKSKNHETKDDGGERNE